MSEMREKGRPERIHDNSWRTRSVKEFIDRQIHNRRFAESGDPSGELFTLALEETEAPAIGSCLLKLQYKKFPAPQPDGANGQLIFSYRTPEVGAERLIAQLNFTDMNGNHYEMVHRQVEIPLLRNLGIGSALLREAEDWFHALATAQHRAVDISFSTHQYDVMKWARASGYQPFEGDKYVFEEIVAHPEHFDISPSDHTIHRKHDHLGAVRLGFQKRIPEKADVA